MPDALPNFLARRAMRINGATSSGLGIGFGIGLALLAACHAGSHAAPGVTMAAGAGVVGANSGPAIAAAEKAARQFAPADVRILCERIAVAQTDEIRMMRQWLGERSQVVPDSLSTRHAMQMGDMVHDVLMPGMLTDDQMHALDQLERNGGLPAARIAAVRGELKNAKQAKGGARASMLAASAAAIGNDIAGAADKGRAQLLQRAVFDLSWTK